MTFTKRRTFGRPSASPVTQGVRESQCAVSHSVIVYSDSDSVVSYSQSAVSSDSELQCVVSVVVCSDSYNVYSEV